MLAQQTGIQFIKASPESGLTSCLDERILAPALETFNHEQQYIVFLNV